MNKVMLAIGLGVVLLAGVVVIITFGQHFKKTSPTAQPSTDVNKTGTTTGTVHFQSLEGGFYGIVADDGQRYDPINLPVGFQKDGLKIRFTFRTMLGQASVHMWGTIIELTSTEEQ